MHKIILSLLVAVALTVAASAQDAQWVPFEVRGGAMVVEVQLAGQSARAALDMDTDMVAIHRGFVAAHFGERRLLRQMTIYLDGEVKKVPSFHKLEFGAFGTRFNLSGVPVVPGPK